MNFLKRKWNALMTWTPDDVLGFAVRVECAGRFCDRVLKGAVILIGIFLLIEVGAAFLPGGAVERVLSGGR